MFYYPVHFMKVRYYCYLCAPFHAHNLLRSMVPTCLPPTMTGSHALGHHFLIAPSSAGPRAPLTLSVIAARNKQSHPSLSCRSSPYLTAGSAARLPPHAQLEFTGHRHFRHSCGRKRVCQASSGGDSQKASEGGATVPVTFEGVYGPWTIEQSDKIEVREEETGTEGWEKVRRCGGGGRMARMGKMMGQDF